MFRLGFSQLRTKNCAALGLVFRQNGRSNLKNLFTDLNCLKTSETSSAVMVNSTRTLFSTPVQYDIGSSIADKGEPTHRPTDFEKKMLVYTKTYAKVEDIPEKVSMTQMKTCKDKFRVICCIWMMVGWVVMAGLVIVMGKRSRAEHIREEGEKSRQRYIEDQMRIQQGGK